jgi:hypothetical protein
MALTAMCNCVSDDEEEEDVVVVALLMHDCDAAVHAREDGTRTTMKITTRNAPPVRGTTPDDERCIIMVVIIVVNSVGIFVPARRLLFRVHSICHQSLPAIRLVRDASRDTRVDG